MKIQKIGPSDWQRLKVIRLDALADAPDAFGSTLNAETQSSDQNWKDRLVSQNVTTLIATINQSDVGLAVGAPYDDDAGLYSMWVAPSARGKGVADRLIASVAHWAKERGHKQLLLDVADSNQAAINLYQRNGFEPTGVTSSLPPPRAHIKEHQRVLPLS